MEIIQKSRDFFVAHIAKYGDPYGLGQHVAQANRWAERILLKERDLNKTSIMIAVWLHDIGHYPITPSEDHAVVSHRLAKAFLEENSCENETMQLVLACIRSHRVNDVMPARREEKLFVAIDSASHLTDSIYFNMAIRDKESGCKFRALEKIERDKRDILEMLPSLWNDVSSLYYGWVRLLTEYQKL